jgi:3-hydroxyisobutyrate dehydrogenase-like beta-hydroxyacid dehydrogenase
VVEVISKGAAQSWQMENRYKTMAAGEYNHGFAVEWMRKDLGICWTRRATTAPACRSPRWSISFTPRSRSMGGKRWDTSSLFARQEAVRQQRKKS